MAKIIPFPKGDTPSKCDTQNENHNEIVCWIAEMSIILKNIEQSLKNTPK